MKSIVSVFLVLILAVAPLGASEFAKQVSDHTATALAIAGVMPFITKSLHASPKAARIADGQLVTAAVTQLLKETSHEWRPDHSDKKSFPSGHTSAAFAMAGSLAAENPKQKWLYIGIASLVGWSRVDLHKHYWHDVAAGAALGYTIGNASSRSEKGWLIGRTVKF